MSKEIQNIAGNSNIKRYFNFIINLSIRLIKWGLRIAFVIFILLILFIISYQISPVREFYNKGLLKLINNNLLAKVEFSDLYIKNYDKIEIRKFRLLADGDTVVSGEKLILQFSIKEIFNDTLVVNNIFIENPIIKVLRNTGDKLWNVNKIAYSSDKPSEPSVPKDFFIKVNKLSINDGFFCLIDSNANHRKDGIIEYLNMQYGELNIQLSAILNLNGPDIKSNIKSLSFNEVVTNTRVNNLSVIATLNSNGAILDSLKLSAPNHYMEANIRVDLMNVFQGIGDKELRNFLYTVDLKGSKINPKFVQKFALIPLNLGETYTINANIQGTLEDLKIKELNYITRNTNLKLKGRLVKIIDTEKARYDVTIYNSTVNDIDLTRILKDINLATIPEFGNTNLDCHIVGSYDSAYVDFKVISTKVGSVEGDAGLKFSSPNWYFANLKMQKMNLSTIIRNSGISSNLSGIAQINGKEFNPNKMKTDIYLNVNAGSIMDYSFSDLLLKAKINNGLIAIDSFAIKQNRTSDSNFTLNESDKYLSINGLLAPFDKNNPNYDLSLKINRINFSEFFKNETLPLNFKGNIRINGNNFNLNKLNLNSIVDISELDFYDRSLFPFKFDFDLKSIDSIKNLNFNSKFLKLSLIGNYNIDNIISLLQNQGQFLGNYISKKLNSISPDFDSTQKEIVLNKISSYKPANFELKAKVIDLSPISPFMGETKVNCEADLELTLDVDQNNSNINIKKLNIEDFNISNNSFNLNINPSDKPLVITGNLNLPLIDSLPKISNLSLAINSETKTIKINDLKLKEPFLKVSLINDTASFSTNTTINDIFEVRALGGFYFDTSKFNIRIDSTRLVYNKSLVWKNQQPINSEISKRGFRVRSFILDRENAESIRIRGLLANNDSNRIGLTITKFPLNGLKSFFDGESKKMVESLSGDLDSLSLRLRGSFNNPDIRFDLAFKDLSYNNIKFNKAFANLVYNNKNITGSSILLVNNNSDLNLSVKEFPIDLSLKEIQNRFFEEKQINAELITNKFPLKLASNFVPAINNLSGNLNSKIKIFGYMPDKIDYKGMIDFDSTSFVLAPTNLHYNANGKITISKDSIILNSIVLKNLNSDRINGSANIFGSIAFNNFNLSYLDINVNAKELMVLNNQSQKSLPDIYGDFIISSGKNPIRFYGTLSEPNLSGDVNIINANLNLPAPEASTKVKTNVKYIRSGNNINLLTLQKDSIEIKQKAKDQKSFADLINYNLWIKILGRFIVNMDLGVVGRLNTEIETQNKNVPLHYTYDRYSQERQLQGKLVVKDGSTLNSFYKIFKTTGSVNFPVGSLDNPGLDLVAEYAGQTSLKNYQSNFIVKIYITGFKERPNIRFDYWVDGQQAKGDSTSISRDAMMLIAFGRTSAGLMDSSAAGFNPAADLGTSGLSNLLSQSFTQMLQGTGIIQSADIDLAGGSWDKARLKLSGQLYGNIVYRVGGTLSDFNNSNEFSIDIPLPYVLHPDLLNNIIIQLTKQTNNANTISTTQKEWEVKFQFGGSW